MLNGVYNVYRLLYGNSYGVCTGYRSDIAMGGKIKKM